jgi:hypothetical protein
MLSDDDKQWIGKLISTEITASEGRMTARIEKVETTLLTEFHKWAQPVASRLQSHTAALRTLDLELEALKGRVDRLETGPKQ